MHLSLTSIYRTFLPSLSNPTTTNMTTELARLLQFLKHLQRHGPRIGCSCSQGRTGRRCSRPSPPSRSRTGCTRSGSRTSKASAPSHHHPSLPMRTCMHRLYPLLLALHTLESSCSICDHEQHMIYLTT